MRLTLRAITADDGGDYPRLLGAVGNAPPQYLDYRASGARAASTGAVPKPIHLGSLSRQVTAPGQTRVTIPIGSKGKRFLKR